MFVLPGILVLVVALVGRPFDLIPALTGLPLLNLIAALAICGFLADLRLRFTEWRATSQFPWLVLLFVWCCFTAVLNERQSLVRALTPLVMAFIVYSLLGQGVRTFKAFEAVAAALLGCALFISVACIHLGMQPTQCVEYWPGETRSSDLGHPDGRRCEDVADCGGGGDESYSCEHAGWFGMTSVQQRVRYVGTLQDPNEVAMFASAALPFAFAFFQRRRTPRRLLLAVGSVVLVAVTVKFTQSRGGLLVMLSVLGVYATQRFGLSKVLRFAPLLLPVLLFLASGKEREDAEESTLHRLGCMMAGLQMFARWPISGVGYGQFLEHHVQTAHNSYVLAVAELGVVGLLLWAMTYYLGVKGIILARRRCTGPESAVARIWGDALQTSLIGMSVGIFFLSFSYHYVLWIFFGLASAYQGAVGTHDRSFRVPVSWRDWVVVVTGNTVILLAVWVYTASKL